MYLDIEVSQVIFVWNSADTWDAAIACQPFSPMVSARFRALLRLRHQALCLLDDSFGEDRHRNRLRAVLE